MIYLVCLNCGDRFVMDEDYVEVTDPDGLNGQTKKVGLDYTGRDCLCPVCGQFAGKLVGGRMTNDE